MHRRNFIKQSSLASAATLLPVTGFSLDKKAKFKMMMSHKVQSVERNGDEVIVKAENKKLSEEV